MKAKLLTGLSCALTTTLCLGLAAAKNRERYVVHEWGTFTSVQGGDGKLLSWHPLRTSELPKFVYSWANPGLARFSRSLSFGKGAMSSLQRMETPVLYFYSEKARTVDVSVGFPQGTISEWYPQAAQIGPASTFAQPPIPALDAAIHKVGVNSDFTLNRFLNAAALKESRIHWADVEVLDKQEGAEASPSFLTDKTGSHYYAARDTDANAIRIQSLVRTNPAPEQDRFLFYRGVGNFSTPLTVYATGDGTITLTNTGPDKLAGLVILNVSEGRAAFRASKELAPGKSEITELPAPSRTVAANANAVAAQLETFLKSSGLYPKEAKAMVNTWKDSWLTEEGVRVLYILPQKWTDQILPISISPAPKELVRVMVGRAEVFTPQAQVRLHDAITAADPNNPESRKAAVRELKRFGRFAEPALSLALAHEDQKRAQPAWALLAEAAKSNVD
jgi:hypothetical protein